MGLEDEIKKIEDELKRTKYNKATQYHIGMLKAKLARLTEQTEKLKTGKKGKGFSVKKSGDATILLVGFPSVGKSTLLTKLTNAESKIGDYDFTTLDIIPGVMKYNSAKIQILDIPGIIHGASAGKGRGKEILSVVRNADLIIILIDEEKQLPVVEKELYNAGFRLNQEKPKVFVSKKHSGGIRIESTVKLTKIDEKMIKTVLNEYRIHNADVVIREDISLDRFIDSLCTNRVYVPSIVVFNKIDMLDKKRMEEVGRRIDCIFISAKNGENLETLKKVLWKKLNLIRIYMKKIREDPDLSEPLIMKKGSKITDVAKRIHKEFAKNFKYARIWGSSKFPGQKVGMNYELKDKDIVELHVR
ncbi:MAG: GTP-binding protein [Candidatus Aenigmarchaeota archaeon]|nr:GTP-binding protein [Candidatus Aenigmarchaeota archaeon]